MEKRRCLTKALLCFILLASNSAVKGQAPQKSKTELRRSLYPTFYSIVDQAEAAPPELKSLALIRVASQETIRDKQWRMELLEEAFDAAQTVEQLAPVIVEVIPLDPKRFMLAAKRNAGIDRLTLQAAAVRNMAALDGEKARVLFDRIWLTTPSIDCSTEFVPNTAGYFQLASFLSKAQAKGVDPIERALRSVDALSQFGPALTMIGQQRHQLIAPITETLKRLPSSERAWFARNAMVQQEITKLLQAVDSADTPELLAAWHAYLTAGLTGAACGDAGEFHRVEEPEIRKTVDAFNAQAELASYASKIPESALTWSKFTPRPPMNDTKAASPKASELQRMIWDLMFGGGKKGLNDAQKRATQWKADFTRYLDAIESLTPADLPPGDDETFAKAEFIGSAVAIAPKGSAEAETALGLLLAHLKTSGQSARTMWRWYAAIQNMASIVQSLGLNRTELDKLFQTSGDSWLKLIGDLEEIGKK